MLCKIVRLNSLINAAVAPNEHTGGQVVLVWCSPPVYAMTNTALAVYGLATKHAIAMQDLFFAKTGWHRQSVGKAVSVL